MASSNTESIYGGCDALATIGASGENQDKTQRCLLISLKIAEKEVKPTMEVYEPVKKETTKVVGVIESWNLPEGATSPMSFNLAINPDAHDELAQIMTSGTDIVQTDATYEFIQAQWDDGNGKWFNRYFSSGGDSGSSVESIKSSLFVSGGKLCCMPHDGDMSTPVDRNTTKSWAIVISAPPEAAGIGTANNSKGNGPIRMMRSNASGSGG